MKNWTIKEAVAVINEGKDTDAIKEIAKHFPVFFMMVAKNDIVGLTSGMGDKFTVRRLEYGATATDEDGDDVAETKEESTEASATEATGNEDLENMSTKQLMQLCDKRGIKVPHYGKNKQFYLEALTGGSEAKAEEEETEEAVDAYKGKSAMELFKLCKSRKIKAEPKMKAADYVKLLKAADASEAEEDGNAEDDDWAEETEEAPAPKKSVKVKAVKAVKAETEEAEDDGDDWDI